jgi:RNA polymerase sigma-70 factor, ECF subfamily
MGDDLQRPAKDGGESINHLKHMLTNTVSISPFKLEESGASAYLFDSGNAETSGTRVNGSGPDTHALSKSEDTWSDAKLIESVRCDPPNEKALDVLVKRHWDALIARCRILTLNHEKALDLAQSAWVRVLRNRQALKPDGNFPAYIATIATNLFRDSYRSARRAGPMSDHRLESLDADCTNGDGDAVALVDVVPDLKTLGEAEQTLLAIDIDRALEQLSPQMRDVLVARFIDGESCAEIGRRYGRTEQAVSGWVRAALRRMKAHLEGERRASDGADWSCGEMINQR